MNNMLEKIREFADRAHGDQKRKYSGERYIVHPIRVMDICNQYTTDQSILAAALLHDVLEDTPVSRLQMKLFLESVMDIANAEKVLKLVIALTDVYTREKFPQLNRKSRRAKETERLQHIPGDAQTVKYADIIDNTIDIANNDKDFARVYLKECRVILSKMTQGHPELHKKAMDTVEENMKRIY